jgi:hypothetical protein
MYFGGVYTILLCFLQLQKSRPYPIILPFLSHGGMY